jgi:hypothetical protein
MDYLKDIYSASRKALQRPIDWLVFFLVAFAVFALFILLPVWTTPGNDIAFQLSIVGPLMYALMTSLALLNALVISMQLYIRRFNTELGSTGIREKSSGFGALMASLVATMGCAACYSSVLAILGLGGSLFVVRYRFWIAGVAIALALIAIHLTAKRINGGCQKCTIQKPSE